MVTPLRKLGRHEQALEAANESLASYKASRASKAHSEEYANWYESIAWQRIGQCLVALDRVDDAQEAFEKAKHGRCSCRIFVQLRRTIGSFSHKVHGLPKHLRVLR